MIWPDVCEDALTVTATIHLSNADIDGPGEVLRENGGKCYPVHFTVSNSNIRNVNEAVSRSDFSSSSSTFGENVSLLNAPATRHGDLQCYGVPFR